MSQLSISESSTMNVNAERVYAILADYRNHHPHILPPTYFGGLQVLDGGVGAGTRFQATLRLLGQSNDFRMLVSEPQPGRVLVESDLESDLLTTFTVLPKGTDRSEVTIATRWTSKRGVAGLMERLLIPSLLRRAYREELGQLEEYATSWLPTAQTEINHTGQVLA